MSTDWNEMAKLADSMQPFVDALNVAAARFVAEGFPQEAAKAFVMATVTVEQVKTLAEEIDKLPRAFGGQR